MLISIHHIIMFPLNAFKESMILICFHILSSHENIYAVNSEESIAYSCYLGK